MILIKPKYLETCRHAIFNMGKMTEKTKTIRKLVEMIYGGLKKVDRKLNCSRSAYEMYKHQG